LEVTAMFKWLRGRRTDEVAEEPQRDRDSGEEEHESEEELEEEISPSGLTRAKTDNI